MPDDPSPSPLHRHLIAEVIRTRARVEAARALADDAVHQAVTGGVQPTELSAAIGVSNRVWVYAAVRRAQAARSSELVPHFYGEPDAAS